ADVAFTESTTGNNFGDECRGRSDAFSVFKVQALANSNLSARPNQALPLIWFCRYLLGQQDLNPALQELVGRRVPGTDGVGLRSASSAIQPGREYAGIVKYNQVTRNQQLR